MNTNDDELQKAIPAQCKLIPTEAQAASTNTTNPFYIEAHVESGTQPLPVITDQLPIRVKPPPNKLVGSPDFALVNHNKRSDKLVNSQVLQKLSGVKTRLDSNSEHQRKGSFDQRSIGSSPMNTPKSANSVHDYKIDYTLSSCSKAGNANCTLNADCKQQPMGPHESDAQHISGKPIIEKQAPQEVKITDNQIKFKNCCAIEKKERQEACCRIY